MTLNSSTTLRRFHGTCIVAWSGLWIIAAYVGWLRSIVFLSHISMATALLGSVSSWQAARIEAKQDQANEQTEA